jgi:hypothetical protein
MAVEETEALGTLIAIAFEVALPPEPPKLKKRSGPAAPPVPPVAVAVAKPVVAVAAVLVTARAGTTFIFSICAAMANPHAPRKCPKIPRPTRQSCVATLR